MNTGKAAQAFTNGSEACARFILKTNARYKAIKEGFFKFKSALP